jgi:uncharacterized protein (DUF486 family)
MKFITPILMLIGSNVFMTYAWYGHLKDLRGKAVIIAIVVSWAVAFFEYCLQVPANRIGFQFFSLAQLKVIQEIITMTVFAGFCVVYMKESLKLDFLWAALCLLCAAYFMFRGFALPN